MKKRKQNRQRNLLHNHPLLRKGGVHEKSNKAKRRNDRQALAMRGFFWVHLLSVLRKNHAFFHSPSG
jgi:hypothetical protein